MKVWNILSLLLAFLVAPRIVFAHGGHPPAEGATHSFFHAMTNLHPLALLMIAGMIALIAWVLILRKKRGNAHEHTDNNTKVTP